MSSESSRRAANNGYWTVPIPTVDEMLLHIANTLTPLMIPNPQYDPDDPTSSQMIDVGKPLVGDNIFPNWAHSISDFSQAEAILDADAGIQAFLQFRRREYDEPDLPYNYTGIQLQEMWSLFVSYPTQTRYLGGFAQDVLREATHLLSARIIGSCFGRSLPAGVISNDQYDNDNAKFLVTEIRFELPYNTGTGDDSDKLAQVGDPFDISVRVGRDAVENKITRTVDSPIQKDGESLTADEQSGRETSSDGQDPPTIKPRYFPIPDSEGV